MLTVSLLNVCLMLLTVVRSDIECSPRPITCHAGTYALGEPAAVSCNLHANMSACKLSVFIVRYPTDAFTTDPGVEIVSCPWDEAKQEHQCSVEKGYDFNEKNGDHPILRIASLGNNSAGFYKCYVMPADNTTTHVCKLTSRVKTVRPETTPTTTTLLPSPADESGKNSPMLPLLLTALICMAGVSTILLVVIVRYRRHIKRLYQNKLPTRYGTGQDSVSPLRPHNQDNSIPTVQKTTAHPDKEIENVMDNFRLDEPEYTYDLLVDLFQKQLKKRNTNESSTAITSLVDRREPRECLVVLLGTSVKILQVKLEGSKVVAFRTKNYYPVPTTGAKEEVPLLQFIANSINDFVNENKLSGQTLPLALVFCFPWEHSQDKNEDRRNIRLTIPIRGFDCENLKRENLTDLLQHYLKPSRCFDIKVVVNDVVDIHMNAVHRNPSCNVAVVIGNGFNASYLQEQKKVKSVITTNCGSFGDNGCLARHLNDFDRDLDNTSLNRGKHILEKMIGGTHLGELVRLVLVKLKQKRLLFKSASDNSALFKMESFSANFISLIESDTDDCWHNTQFVLRQLSLESFSDGDCRTVRYVCMVISERAAYLAAAGLAAVVKHAKLSDVTVAVDSSPYLSHPRFCQLMQEKTRELLGETVELAFKQSLNDNGKGAVLLAAAT